MKKILLTFLVLSCLPTLANEVDFTPQWSNIAPVEYSGDIQYIENNTFDKTTVFETERFYFFDTFWNLKRNFH